MSSKKKTSVRAGAKSTNKPPPSTPAKGASDKARKAASAEIQERIERLDATDAPGPDPTAAQDAAETKPSTTRGKGAKAAPAGTSAKSAKTPAPKPAKEPKAKKVKTPKPPKVKKVSCLDAAAQVLAASDKPMKATDMIAAMEAKGLWKTGKGLTPEATLYAAVIREIAAKGREARFKKHDRGLFVAGKGAN
ncbi:MAG: winged helix-turn-helix domain-containing protein [Phycisphaerales bacterium]|nr:winged helix-turn-helix domain-containing protein [Phycisphaerales bacterium]